MYKTRGDGGRAKLGGEKLMWWPVGDCKSSRVYCEGGNLSWCQDARCDLYMVTTTGASGIGTVKERCRGSKTAARAASSEV